jgi:hypothetical protein
VNEPSAGLPSLYCESLERLTILLENRSSIFVLYSEEATWKREASDGVESGSRTAPNAAVALRRPQPVEADAHTLR